MCGSRSEEDVARVDRLSEELGTISSLNHAFEAILNVILISLDAPAVFMRTKALRALGQIVTADPGILKSVCILFIIYVVWRLIEIRSTSVKQLKPICLIARLKFAMLP